MESHEVAFALGKVGSVTRYLLPDVRIIPYLLLPAWVEFSSGIGIVRSGTSRAIYIGKEPRKPSALWRGHLVFLADVGQ